MAIMHAVNIDFLANLFESIVKIFQLSLLMNIKCILINIF
jgi:hypothetical protein